MAGRFPPAWLDELRARADIVSIVSTYVPLKRNGHRYWGLCPFHNEKTASFSVDPERQLYHCFGCKAGGSVIQFVMEMERLDFPDAVRYLADQLNMPLPQMQEDPDYQRKKTQRELLLSINLAAAQYFHKLLFTPAGSNALAYLKDRGLSDGAIMKFGLGAASAGWEELTQHLLKEGYTLEDLRLVGLTVVKENRSFDMFRNRAIFPIIDLHGNVLGFGGRIMGDGQPKYLNTSDTPVFNKRHTVYAANLLRKTRNLKRIILVEGYMDVVALTQFGVEGVVATLGTALTQEQARLLKRFAPQVWVAYDGDSAGQHAILRALDIFEQENIPAKVLDFPDKLDPDDFIRQNGLEAFQDLAPVTNITYRMRRKEDEFDLSTQDGRTEYAKACAKILRKVTQPVELDNYLTQLATRTGFSREVLMAQIGTALPAAQHIPAKKRESFVKRTAPVSESQKAQETLLSLLATGRLPQDVVALDEFDDPEIRTWAQELLNGESAASILENQSDESARNRAAQLLLSPGNLSQDQVLRMTQECLIGLKRTRLEEKIQALGQKMSTLQGAEKKDAIAQAQVLVSRLNELKSFRK